MKFLTPYVQSVEKALNSLSLPEKPVTLYSPQQYMLKSGGKRIRPVLTLMSCGMCGVDRYRALPAAVAIEMVHNFTLIHDDIMDQAQSRRGKPAIHLKWNPAIAILAGDSMFTQAMMQLSDLPGDVDYQKLTELFLEGINHVCEGQALDMEFEKNPEVSIEEYLLMIGGKTGGLIVTSLQMGGMIGGCSSEELDQLTKAGRFLGYGFQIQDDWLDVVADPDKFGKKPAGDIYEGKKTYLMVLALERCNKNQKKWLLQCLQSKPLSEEMVEQVVHLYSQLGVIEDAESQMIRYYSEAEKIVETFGESEDKRDLIKLIQTLKKREY